MTMPRTPRTFSLSNPTATAWFPHAPAIASAVIDMADARTVALRERLRNHYWLRGCAPLTAADIDLQRRKMRLICAADEVDDVALAALLVPSYGFQACTDGWTIPDLDHHHREVLGQREAASARGAAGGKASAAKRASGAPAGEQGTPRGAPTMRHDSAEEPADF